MNICKCVNTDSTKTHHRTDSRAVNSSVFRFCLVTFLWCAAGADDLPFGGLILKFVLLLCLCMKWLVSKVSMLRYHYYYYIEQKDLKLCKLSSSSSNNKLIHTNSVHSHTRYRFSWYQWVWSCFVLFPLIGLISIKVTSPLAVCWWSVRKRWISAAVAPNVGWQHAHDAPLPGTTLNPVQTEPDRVKPVKTWSTCRQKETDVPHVFF